MQWNRWHKIRPLRLSYWMWILLLLQGVKCAPTGVAHRKKKTKNPQKAETSTTEWEDDDIKHEVGLGGVSSEPCREGESNVEENYPLYQAALRGNLDRLRCHLGKSSRFSTQDFFFKELSLLHFAAGGGKAHVVTFLLQHLPKGITIDNFPNTPPHSTALDFAVLGGHVHTASLLLQRGATVGMSLIYEAAGLGSLPMVRLLVEEYGADANARNGETPLHRAANGNSDEHLKVVQYLVEKHTADVNAVDTRKCTPLHCAVRNSGSNLKIVQYLVKKGADLHAKNTDNKTPEEAAEEDNPAVRRFLRQKRGE